MVGSQRFLQRLWRNVVDEDTGAVTLAVLVNESIVIGPFVPRLSLLITSRVYDTVPVLGASGKVIGSATAVNANGGSLRSKATGQPRRLPSPRLVTLRAIQRTGS